MDGVIQWLSQLPLGVLYIVLALTAAVENVFPPLPADTVVAFGSWLAAKGQGNVLIVLAATCLGNIAGAAGMFFAGRKRGAGWMRRKFPKLTENGGEERMRRWYARYGVVALVICRFIPGVRAIVPVFAGALHAPPLLAISAMAIASITWYGLISYVGFTAGSDWQSVLDVIGRYGKVAAIVGTAIVAAALGVWLVRRRRSGS